jgi:hypothetical protein
VDFADLERKMAKNIQFGHMFGRAAVMVVHDELAQKNAVQVMQEDMKANRGILKRNLFLAKQLGHHV